MTSVPQDSHYRDTQESLPNADKLPAINAKRSFVRNFGQSIIEDLPSFNDMPNSVVDMKELQSTPGGNYNNQNISNELEINKGQQSVDENNDELSLS